RRLTDRSTAEDDRHGEDERREHVEVVEGHRQVEEVGGEGADKRGRQAPSDRPQARRRRVAGVRQRAAERAGGVQAAEQVPEEHEEDDAAGLDQERDVERVRPPVRLAGDELVVDGEVVEAEAEQRVAGEHVGDEVVDAEMDRRRAVLVDTRERITCSKKLKRERTTIPTRTSAAASGTSRSREASRRRYGSASTSRPTPRPRSPLRDSVASSTIRKKASTVASWGRSRCPRGSRR